MSESTNNLPGAIEVIPAFDKAAPSKGGSAPIQDWRWDGDVLVLGDGPAGAAAALTLARQGRSVVVLGRERAAPVRAGESLPPAAVPVLNRLGVWQAFMAAGHTVSPGIVAEWGDGPPYETDFVLSPYGAGWHIDRARFDADLVDAARAAGAEWLCGVGVLNCHCGEDMRWRFHVECGDGLVPARISASWVIDATGRSAWFARHHGARRHTLDRLVALVGEIPSAHQADRRLALEARPDGWWYSAVVPGGRAVVAWMCDADLVPRGHEARRQAWLDGLAQTHLIRERVGRAAPAGPVRTIAACSSALGHTVGPGWIAVGDAAMTCDPLSGKGILRALESGEAAAHALLAWFAGEHDAPTRLASADARAFDRYRQLRVAYYSRERRWPSAPFWKRRSVTAQLPAGRRSPDRGE